MTLPGSPRQRVGAGVVLLDDRIRLVRRRDNAYWDLPGGGVEPGEEPLAAARRELYGETSPTAGPLTVLGVFSGKAHRHVYLDGNVVDGVTVLYVGHPLAGDAFSGDPSPGDDAAGVVWWPLVALPQDLSAALWACCAALRASSEAP